jgi:hypothetical protein
MYSSIRSTQVLWSFRKFVSDSHLLQLGPSKYVVIKAMAWAGCIARKGGGVGDAADFSQKNSVKSWA